MPILTVFRKDGSKQVVNSTEAILKDNKNNKLHPMVLRDKLTSIAKTIVGTDYLNHKFSTN